MKLNLPSHPWLLNNDVVYQGAYAALASHFRAYLVMLNSKSLSGVLMIKNIMLLTYRHLYNYLCEKYI